MSAPSPVTRARICSLLAGSIASACWASSTWIGPKNPAHSPMLATVSSATQRAPRVLGRLGQRRRRTPAAGRSPRGHGLGHLSLRVATRERTSGSVGDLRPRGLGRRPGLRGPDRPDLPPGQGARHGPDRLRPARRAQRVPPAHRRRAAAGPRARADVQRRRLRAAHRQRPERGERQAVVLHRRRPADPRPHGLSVRRGRDRRDRSTRPSSAGCTSSSASG